MPEIIVYGGDNDNGDYIQIEGAWTDAFTYEPGAKMLVLGQEGAAVLVTPMPGDDGVWSASVTVLNPGPMGQEATHHITQRPSEFGEATGNEAAAVFVPGPMVYVFKVVPR